jgi:hypothetical protein
MQAPLQKATMTIPVPTLSTQGWVTDQAGKLDFLLSHFFLADFNQTFLYVGQVVSLPEIIQKSGGDAAAVIPELQRKLKAYLLKYYSNVELEVSSKTDLNTDPTSKIELMLILTLGDNGVFSSYNRLLQSKDSRLNQIIKLNNEGLTKITGAV